MSVPTTVLVLPSPAQGHVNPMMIFSQKLVEYGCNVIFVNTEFIHNKVVSSMGNQESGVTGGSPIKLVSMPDGLGPDADRNNFLEVSYSILKNMPAMVEKLIEDVRLKDGVTVSCVVADFFMAWGLETASKIGIKGVLFCPAPASLLALHCSIPRLIDDGIIDSNELALGLELTNRPFLWVVRQDSDCNNKVSLPNEFKGNQGKIVKWAPQQKVLSHPAIACFVSHCGWNSTIEGLSNGVPFLCWPYFSDQFLNKTYICNELKVGLGFDSNENGLISREEIKVKVDKLLSDENIRSKAQVLKEKLLKDIKVGGRSSENLNKFINWLKE
ncbi:hypothetical protein PIB30_047325 [Stylosanthes scabra]|uniref:Uncharacterized protein n=1 Tax=Stylosanthes scabra TaxID=79078 RepID=A0ABU6QGB2_9FABA|nr:hypothetical protein [Stylosanthes scabra]